MGTNTKQRDDGGVAFVDDASSSEMFKVGGTGSRNGKIARMLVTGNASTAGGGLFAWVNPENVAIIVTRFDLDVLTKSTGASNVSIGSAANGTTSSANLIDTYAIGATEKVINSGDDKGTNGKGAQKVAVGAFVTATASATTAGLSGYAYLHYYLV